MKALSFSQPWLWAVLHANKNVENRSWAPPIEMIDQRFALHAAKSWDEDGVSFIFRTLTASGHHQLLDSSLPYGMPNRRDNFPKSAIVGVACIDRIVTDPKSLPDDQKPWFFGPFGWLLCNKVWLPEPIPCTGKLGLWTVPDELDAQIVAQLRSL